VQRYEKLFDKVTRVRKIFLRCCSTLNVPAGLVPHPFDLGVQKYQAFSALASRQTRFLRIKVLENPEKARSLLKSAR
jgi:hypothetical protein